MLDKFNQFQKEILDNIDYLEKLIDSDGFAKSEFRIGAEQEICLVDKFANAAPLNLDILKKLENSQWSTELAKYNLELNLSPRKLKGNAFSELEEELKTNLDFLAQNSIEFDTRAYLGGILPTLRFMDLDIENITPSKRYFQLVNSIYKNRGEEYELRIQGEDELLMKYNSVFIEAATTSFQIHLEVPPDKFAKIYNISQLIAAPMIALAANSNILLKKRLWHETRIALLRQSIDTSKTPMNTRDSSSRVSFGNQWVKSSILELFREDIALHRMLMVPELNKNSNSEPYSLFALQNYNSTVYRWNRPVYGVYEGSPHLRIENRILPAGPTIIDQVANAAFWYGLIFGIFNQNIDFENKLEFSTVKNNFIQASRTSLNSRLEWYDGNSYNTIDLILNQLIPLAINGLELLKINKSDIEIYIDTIRKRVEAKTNGAIWMYKSSKNLQKNGVLAQDSFASMVEYSLEKQEKNIPIYQWEILSKNMSVKKQPNEIVVEECMEKDIYTVRPEDIIQLASDTIEWQKIRYLIVEDSEGKLQGIISSRNLLKSLNRHLFHKETIPLSIEEIMVGNPMTIESNAKLSVALEMMQKYHIGCLPVIQNEKLVGIITEQTFLNVMQNLMD